jgi:GST-like protein
MFGQVHHFVRSAKEKVPYGIERYSKEKDRLYAVLDKRLGEMPYLAGEYSIADIATYPWLRNIPALMGAETMAKFSNVARWVKAIDERPAVKVALAKVDQVRAQTTQFDKATADNLDRLLARGKYAAA